MNKPTSRLGYSIRDAAHEYGLSEGTIKKLIRSGEIAAVKIGRRTVITDEALRNWQASLPPARSAA